MEMTTPVITSKNQSDGVKMDMTTPVITTKVLWFVFMDFVKYLSYSLIYFHMDFQQSYFNIFFIWFIYDQVIIYLKSEIGLQFG
jgi:hypothetical protein